MINSKQKHLSCKKEKTAVATKRDCGQGLCYHQHPNLCFMGAYYSSELFITAVSAAVNKQHAQRAADYKQQWDNVRDMMLLLDEQGTVP